MTFRRMLFLSVVCLFVPFQTFPTSSLSAARVKRNPPRRHTLHLAGQEKPPVSGRHSVAGQEVGRPSGEPSGGAPSDRTEVLDASSALRQSLVCLAGRQPSAHLFIAVHHGQDSRTHTHTHRPAHVKKKTTHSNVQSCTSSDSQLHPSETSSHSAAPRHGHKTNYADWHFGTSLCEDKQRRVPSQRRVAITAAPTRSKGVHLPLRLQKVQR